MKEMTFSTHYQKVELSKIGGASITIIPVGDVHWDTPNCDRERWLEFLRHLKKDTENQTPNNKVMLLGTGDWLDFVSWSERKKLRSMNLHESTIARFDQAALRDCTEFLDELWFTRGMWMGGVNGNHQWEFSTDDLAGKTSDEYLCERLGCKQMGDLAYIRLGVGFKNTGKRTVIDIVVCHGKAGGKLAGTTINQVADLMKIFPAADIYIMGHDHRKAAVPVTTLQVNTGQNSDELSVKQHRQWLCRSGSFLRGYVENQQSYVVKGLYAPTDLGIIKLECNFKAKSGSILTNDIHVWY